MAEFDPAVDFVLKHEGGYSDDPHDAGGETKFGISQKYHPDVDIPNLTVDQAKAIYFDTWVRYRWREFDSQDVANKVFDYAVNMGPSHAHRVLQRALRACGQLVEEDGKLGPKTLAAANLAPEIPLLVALRCEGAAWYRMKRDPHFERGWLNRAYA